MVFKDQTINIIVTNIQQEQSVYWSIYFRRPINFVFEAGDWIDIVFLGHDLAGGRTFSISSSPTESDIRISFRAGVSPMKQTLQSVKVGDVLLITQYGNDYGFQLKQNQPSVLIAGGVGIAPFRSMMKQLYDTYAMSEVHLIYLNQTDAFLFRKELNEWSANLPHVSVSYIVTKGINRKKREKLILAMINSINQNFYIAGPPSMVESNEHLLIDMGVTVRNIRIDSFSGY